MWVESIDLPRICFWHKPDAFCERRKEAEPFYSLKNKGVLYLYILLKSAVWSSNIKMYKT